MNVTASVQVWSVPLTPSWRVHMEDPSLLWCCWQNAFKTCYYRFLACRQGNSATFIFPSLSLSTPPSGIRPGSTEATPKHSAVILHAWRGDHVRFFSCKVITAPRAAEHTETYIVMIVISKSERSPSDRSAPKIAIFLITTQVSLVLMSPRIWAAHACRFLCTWTQPRTQ